jgi:hypothetical protein
MKKICVIMILCLVSGCILFGDPPKGIEYTQEEKQWYEEVKKKYPYKVILYKADMYDGYADIQDSSFNITIEYDSLKIKDDYGKIPPVDILEIIRSYSKIRDYKSEVSTLIVDIEKKTLKLIR